MDLQNNSLDSRADLSQFLEKFKEPAFPASEPVEEARSAARPEANSPTNRYEKTFEKLEQKIEELEARFDATSGQNQLILNELARQREALSNQKDRDAFVEHLSHTIANLKASVENLARMQQPVAYSFPAPDVQRGFDTAPRSFGAPSPNIYQYEPETYRAFREERQRAAQEERERIIASLHQKASQLKAVNSALDREIKKVQQEKMAALKKSAEQAKEILSLREQLTAAEEKFKSFDFEGRIISIRQEYEQKVSSLEIQLQEVSATCMKQVEEIESLRAQNIKLQHAAQEKEQMVALLAQKEQELNTLKAKISALEQNHSDLSKQELAVFSQRLHTLEEQRDALSGKLQEAQAALDRVRGEKEMLEKNFRELMQKIDQNDAIIGQLKEKIEVLGQQNKTLAEQNAQLSEEKVSYQMRVRSAEQDREVLMSRSEALAHAKQTVEAQVAELTQANATLLKEKKTAQAKAEQLAGEKETLAQKAQKTDFLLDEKAALHEENQHLRNQSAALLAARLVQEKGQAAKEASVPEPAQPAEKAKQPSANKASTTKTDGSASFDGPVTITQRAKASVTTSADLPEIKVADPTPQPESTFDGEDFLEKTDSFIGRMKWSLFREDK